MLKDYFEVPNKPAIKSGNVLSCDFTDHETFIPQPLDFTRNTLATYVDCNGIIKVSGVSDTNLVENGTFETPVNANQWFDFANPTIAERSQTVAYEGNFSYHIKGDSTNSGTQASASQFAGDYVIGDTVRVRAYIYPITASFNQIKSGVNGSNRGITTAAGGLVLNQWNLIEYYAEITTASNNYVSFLISGTAGEFYLDNVSVNKVDVNVPRIDYLTEIGKAKELQKPSLLLEPQSTNVITYSEDFSRQNTPWNTTQNAVEFEYNSTTAPDNETKAAKISKTSTRIYGSFFTGQTITSAVNYSWSCFFKAGTHSVFTLQLTQGDTEFKAYFDLDNQTSGMYTGSATTKIENYGNGWFRCSLAGISSTTDVSVRFNLGLAYTTSNENWPSASDGEGLYGYIWGAQLEQQNHATSYIPTSGSTVTRNVEQAIDAGSIPVFNGEEGTFYGEFASLGKTGVTRRMSVSDGSNINRATITISSGNPDRINVLYKAGGSNQFSVNLPTSVDTTNMNKVAFTWKQGEYRVVYNGQQHATGSITTLTTVPFSEFGFTRSAVTDKFYARIREIKIFRRALTLEELTELTNNIV